MATEFSNFARNKIWAFALAARSLWWDTDGVILPYVTILLVVLIGTSVLALDGGRYGSLQTQLYKGADALAIAGAAELDRLPDSITRATAAVNNLVTNSSIFGTGGAANVSVQQIRFLDSLPASDTSAITSGNVLCTMPGCTANHAVLAQFIEVTVTPTAIPTILPAAFLPGGSNVVTAGASAVAGNDQVACHFAPVFICNPFETAGMTYAQATAALQNAVADPTVRRRLIDMRQHSGSGNYSPGNWGFLQSPLLPGANALRDALALVDPPTCFRQNSVTTQTGFIASANDALNVRFDIYNGSANGFKNNPAFRPAMNVRKGYQPGGGTCNSSPGDPSRYRALTWDNCFNTNTCPYMGGRMGDGNWDFDGYWAINQVGQPKPTVNGATASNSNPPSRYDVYRYEIAQGLINHPSKFTPAEVGNPQCSITPTDDNPDRRILYAAIVNCQSNFPPSLPLAGGNDTDVPVAAFAKIFVTQPVTLPQSDILGEITGLVSVGNSSGFFNQVQLYR